MAVVLNKSIFIHIPKTGGTWVIEALKRSNLFKLKGRVKHPSLVEFRCIHPNVKLNNMKVFAFVRNPVTWWQSRWSDPFHRRHFLQGLESKDIGRCGSIRWFNYESMIMNESQFDDFNTYIESMLERRPGFASEYFRFMTNTKDIIIGSYERIGKDLVEILYRCGEDFDMDAILSTPKVNESNKKLNRLYKEENLKAIINAEKRMMDQYGYSTNIDDYSDLIITT